MSAKGRARLHNWLAYFHVVFTIVVVYLALSGKVSAIPLLAITIAMSGYANFASEKAVAAASKAEDALPTLEEIEQSPHT